MGNLRAKPKGLPLVLKPITQCLTYLNLKAINTPISLLVSIVGAIMQKACALLVLIEYIGDSNDTSKN